MGLGLGKRAAGDLPVLEMVHLHRPQPHLTGPPPRETRRRWRRGRRPAPAAARAGGRAGGRLGIFAVQTLLERPQPLLHVLCGAAAAQ